MRIKLPSSEILNIPIAKSSTVSQLKEAICRETSIPLGKQKLCMEDGTVMKNSSLMSTLASGTLLELASKERGGRK